jgi:hypothetical protein
MPERVGLCAKCRFALVQKSATGSRFWRCRLAEESEHFLRYPPLPMQQCSGFEPVSCDESASDDSASENGPAGPRPF